LFCWKFEISNLYTLKEKGRNIKEHHDLPKKKNTAERDEVRNRQGRNQEVLLVETKHPQK
jgi:hypothetical protein